MIVYFFKPKHPNTRPIIKDARVKIHLGQEENPLASGVYSAKVIGIEDGLIRIMVDQSTYEGPTLVPDVDIYAEPFESVASQKHTYQIPSFFIADVYDGDEGEE